jgi:hypothetical protein
MVVVWSLGGVDAASVGGSGRGEGDGDTGGHEKKEEGRYGLAVLVQRLFRTCEGFFFLVVMFTVYFSRSDWDNRARFGSKALN